MMRAAGMVAETLSRVAFYFVVMGFSIAARRVDRRRRK